MERKRFQGELTDPAPLAQPLHFEFSGRTARNRLHKSPITERLSTWHPTDLPKRGIPTKELVHVYRRWGEGGFGLMATGNVMIEYDHLEAAGNPIIPREAPFSGERFEAFQEVAEAGKKNGALIVAQLSHPGRQVPSEIQPYPLSASDVQIEGTVMGMTFGKPRAMNKQDIEKVVDGFAHAAEYCYKAGFDGVEIHAAHGYLLAQFLALTTNKRTDEYGGPLSNRARIIFEIADAIRARVPKKSFILGIKINSVEFQSGGIAPEDCKWICVELERHGLDFVELSGGTYEAIAFSHKRESSRKREAYFLEFADMIVPELKRTKAYVTGGLRTVSGMVKALDTVHGIGLARPICNEFDLPHKILSGQVQGALDCLLDEQDYLLTDVAAGTQVRIVGKDKAPLDFTQEKYLNVFQEAMQKWMQEKAEDTDGSTFGWVDIDDEKLQPYGKPYSVPQLDGLQASL
ncbi:uncharacterized protein BCR38DRAFT_419545 [Pseudomassariella vexata]|uniref:NADH:flavin oxidoreductase/NADH oxidase N-terminal domain-containing protein n=1 Tax=Pseudomassariella vexata TaxID=1141098 RepID=A0A1Y2EDG3_9PEZI|nr:uncharacterized protein BCR38DRAFT_419545 [Pseudomassariella vexata]ORY69600.1 hypothetical protein BCR38DRAFT_419545 [Pseudomassariella vexata]